MSKNTANPKSEKIEVTLTSYTTLKTYRLLCAKSVLTKALKEHAIPGAWSSVEDQNLWTLPFETVPSISVTSMNVVEVLPSSFASTFHQMITLAGGMEVDKKIAIPGPVLNNTVASGSSVGGRQPTSMRDGGGIKSPHTHTGTLKAGRQFTLINENPFILKKRWKTNSNKYAIDGSVRAFASSTIIYKGSSLTIADVTDFTIQNYGTSPVKKNGGSQYCCAIGKGVNLNYYPTSGIFGLTGQSEECSAALPPILVWLNTPTAPLTPPRSKYTTQRALSQPRSLTIDEAAQNIISNSIQVNPGENEVNAPPPVDVACDEQRGSYNTASIDLFTRTFSKKGMTGDFILLLTNHASTVFKTIQNLNGKNDSTTKKWVKDYTENEMKDLATKHKKWMIKTANEWATVLSAIYRNCIISNSLPNPQSVANTSSQNILARQIDGINLNSSNNAHLLVGVEARVSSAQDDLRALQKAVKELQDLNTKLQGRVFKLETADTEVQQATATCAGTLGEHEERLTGMDERLDGLVTYDEVKEMALRLEDCKARVNTLEGESGHAGSGGLEEDMAALKAHVQDLPTAGEINLTKARQDSQTAAMATMVGQIKLIKGENVALLKTVKALEMKITGQKDAMLFNQRIGLTQTTELEENSTEMRAPEPKRCKTEPTSPPPKSYQQRYTRTLPGSSDRSSSSSSNSSSSSSLSSSSSSSSNSSSSTRSSGSSGSAPLPSWVSKVASFKRSVVATLTAQCAELPGAEMDRVASAISEFPRPNGTVHFSGINDYLLANVKEYLKDDAYIVAAVIWNAYVKAFPKEPREEHKGKGSFRNRGGRGRGF